MTQDMARRGAGPLTCRLGALPLAVPVALLAGTLVFLTVTGFLAPITDSRALDFFGLDRELRGAAFISAALLVLAGVALFLALQDERLPLRLPLPAFLVFMAADEVASLHERIEAGTGVDWQVLYLPLFAVAGLVWLLVVRAWRPTSLPGLLLTVGAGAWVVSQVLENLEWGPGDVMVDGYATYVLFEELLEPTGSACFVLAGLLAVRSATRRLPGATGLVAQADVLS